MAELPSKVHLTSHPMYLDICGPSLYADENNRAWLHLIVETGGDLKIRLCQVNIPIGNAALTTSPLTSNNMPLWWALDHGSRYLDSMGRLWRIVNHAKVDDTEEMVLELMDDS